MAQFDPGYTRLKTIIILILFIFSVYTCEVVFFGQADAKKNVMGTFEGAKATAQPNTGLWESISTVIDMLVGWFVMLFQIITFTLPGIAVWMTIILAPIMITTIGITVYIIIDFIYTIIRGVPLFGG